MSLDPILLLIFYSEIGYPYLEMSEIITREIVGVAQKSKWESLKHFLKDLINETLNTDTGYVLIAFDAFINNEKHPEYDYHIKSKADIKQLNLITDFSQLSLYQYTDTTSNHVDITLQDDILVMIAKYMGPYLSHQKYFNFSVHLDALNPPYFSDGIKNNISCSEILSLIDQTHKKKDVKKSKKIQQSYKPVKDREKEKEKNIEELAFEKSKGKNAIWAGKETKTFKIWKEVTANKYRKKTGNTAYYKGKPTKNFEDYLKKSLHHKNSKKKKPSKNKINNNITLLKIAPKKTKIISEEIAYEKLTGKKAYWAGKKTKAFTKWKEKVIKNYRNKTGKNPYYKGKMTKYFKIYINELILNNTNLRPETK